MKVLKKFTWLLGHDHIEILVYCLRNEEEIRIHSIEPTDDEFLQDVIFTKDENFDKNNYFGFYRLDSGMICFHPIPKVCDYPLCGHNLRVEVKTCCSDDQLSSNVPLLKLKLDSYLEKYLASISQQKTVTPDVF